MIHNSVTSESHACSGRGVHSTASISANVIATSATGRT
jgi:hypothetical protein